MRTVLGLFFLFFLGCQCQEEECQDATPAESSPEMIDSDGDGFSETTDCNEKDDSIYPGAVELCDGVDQNCDGVAEILSLYYLDGDEDGYGNWNTEISAYCVPDGYVENNEDCNDTNAGVHPGSSETCNFIDDDCNGYTDDGTGVPTYQSADTDIDGYGDPKEYGDAAAFLASSSTTTCDRLRLPHGVSEELKSLSLGCIMLALNKPLEIRTSVK